MPDLATIGCANCKRTKRYVQLCNECYERGQVACRFCSGTGVMPAGFDMATGEERNDDLCGCAAGQARASQQPSDANGGIAK